MLYEIGGREPALIARYHTEFIKLLESRNNRLVWGAMTALDAIASQRPKAINGALPRILAAAERGSDITRDRAVNILITLASIKQYAPKAFSLLMQQLQHSPANQLPMYAENALPLINESTKAAFVKLLGARLNDIEKESKRKRIEKVLTKVSRVIQ